MGHPWLKSATYTLPPRREPTWEERWWALYRELAQGVGVLAALITWGYAGVTYGIFLGVGLGWLPALGVGLVAGLAWPLLAVGLVGFIGFVLVEMVKA